MFKLGEVLVTESGNVWGIVEEVTKYDLRIRYLFLGDNPIHHHTTYHIADPSAYNH